LAERWSNEFNRSDIRNLAILVIDIPTNQVVAYCGNVHFDRKQGGTYRLDDSFGAMVNYAVTPTLKIGYAYDHIVSDLKVTTPSSHEIILLFDVNFSKKVSRSPRYF
jgi:hypothetical protein